MRGLCGESHDSDCRSKEEVEEKRRRGKKEANNSNNVGWGERPHVLSSAMSQFDIIGLLLPCAMQVFYISMSVSEFARADALPETERSLRSSLLERGRRLLFPTKL